MNNDLPLPAERRIAEYALNRRAQHLMESISPTQRAPRTSRRLLWVTGVGVTSAVMATSGAAWAYQQFSDATVTDQVRCYSMLELGDGEDFPGSTVTSPDMMAGQSMTPQTAIDACSTLWLAGALVKGDPQTHEPYQQPSKAPPKLTACVIQDGVIGVFPGDPDSCAALGLPQLKP